MLWALDTEIIEWLHVIFSDLMFLCFFNSPVILISSTWTVIMATRQNSISSGVLRCCDVWDSKGFCLTNFVVWNFRDKEIIMFRKGNKMRPSISWQEVPISS